MTDYSKENIKISAVKIKQGYHLAFDYQQMVHGSVFHYKNTEIAGQVPAKELINALEALKQDVLYAVEFPVSADLDEKRIKINSVSFGLIEAKGPRVCSFGFQLYFPQREEWSGSIKAPVIMDKTKAKQPEIYHGWDQKAMDRIQIFYDCCLRYLQGENAQESLDFKGEKK